MSEQTETAPDRAFPLFGLVLWATLGVLVGIGLATTRFQASIESESFRRASAVVEACLLLRLGDEEGAREPLFELLARAERTLAANPHRDGAVDRIIDRARASRRDRELLDLFSDEWEARPPDRLDEKTVAEGPAGAP